jgi:hypothetical protein
MEDNEIAENLDKGFMDEMPEMEVEGPLEFWYRNGQRYDSTKMRS